MGVIHDRWAAYKREQASGTSSPVGFRGLQVKDHQQLLPIALALELGAAGGQNLAPLVFLAAGTSVFCYFVWDAADPSVAAINYAFLQLTKVADATGAAVTPAVYSRECSAGGVLPTLTWAAGAGDAGFTDDDGVISGNDTGIIVTDAGFYEVWQQVYWTA